MPQHLLRWGSMLMMALGLWILMGWLSSAQAVIVVRSAAVVNGVAVVEGGKAARGAPIFWEGAQVTQANNGGNFAFQGEVPADCAGSLAEGNPPGGAINVALANCVPVPPPAGAPAPVPQTGQTQCWDTAGAVVPCDGTGQDGDLQAGVAWPVPRFTDNGNGTVRDNLTGLLWLKDASCDAFGPNGNGTVTWQQALNAANTLANGHCNLTDGSAPGDWRLPNIMELRSLIGYGFERPLSNAAGDGSWTEGDAFVDVRDYYWSSTTPAMFAGPSRAWFLNIDTYGSINALDKTTTFLKVWPVRGGN